VHHKLKEIEAVRMQEKLTCYQKTRGSDVQKEDTTMSSSSKVNSLSLTPEELVHLGDVSVTSKYGANLALLSRILAEDMRSTLNSFRYDLEDMRSTLNSFRYDLDNNLPKQIHLVVKEVMGNVEGERASELGSPPT
jgi:hypothetical protein